MREEQLFLLLEKFEQRLDSHEEMLARLLAGISQLWSALEALIEMTLEGKPKEEREQFESGLRWYSSELWKAIHARGSDMARGAATPSGTMADLPGE